jgi:hypothetical protein
MGRGEVLAVAMGGRRALADRLCCDREPEGFGKGAGG